MEYSLINIINFISTSDSSSSHNGMKDVMLWLGDVGCTCNVVVVYMDTFLHTRLNVSQNNVFAFGKDVCSNGLVRVCVYVYMYIGCAQRAAT